MTGLVQRGEFADGPPKPGISDLVATALVLLGLHVVRRETIRALCPETPLERHNGEKTRCSIGSAINGAFRRFEKLGLIKRRGRYIRVIDPDGLRAWVEQSGPLDEARAATMLAVVETARTMDIASVAAAAPGSTALDAEVRRMELIALHRLMRSAPGASSSERNPVRIVPRGTVL